MSGRKVLHMHFGKDGGAERFFVSLAEAFAEAGMEQRFATRPGRAWQSEIAALGPVMTSHYRRASPITPVFTWRVHRMIEAWKPDVIMAWMSRASRLMPHYPGAVKLSRLGDYPRHLRHFRNNDLIVANTPGIAEACQALGWTRPAKVISNFAREGATVPVSRVETGTPEDAFVISGVGRFVSRKGFDVLVNAAAEVPGAWLWLIGTGEQEAALKAQVEALGLSHRTRFFGWVAEPMHLVAASDVFVMPSRHEPLGNVILEAWRAGVPVVSTRTEGPIWFARDGGDALLVAVDAPDAMAAAITRVREDAGLARRLVAGGRATLEARFTKLQVVAQYEAIFDGQY